MNSAEAPVKLRALAEQMHKTALEMYQLENVDTYYHRNAGDLVESARNLTRWADEIEQLQRIESRRKVDDGRQS